MLKKRKAYVRTDFSGGKDLSESESDVFRKQLLEIERSLNNRATDVRLWESRLGFVERLNIPVQIAITRLNIAVLTNDFGVMCQCAQYYIHEIASKDMNELFLKDSLTAAEKGKLLVEIRSEKIPCEFHFILLLYYSYLFEDYDIFVQAVEGLKTGFASESRSFFNLLEKRRIHTVEMNTESRVELLSESIDDLKRIEANMRKMMVHLSNMRDFETVQVIKYMMHKLMSIHLSENTANKLFPRLLDELAANFMSQEDFDIKARQDFERVKQPYYRRSPVSYKDAQINSFHGYFLRLIHDWPNASEKKFSLEVARWYKLFTMSKIKETPLREFFTGDLYKPPYSFVRKEEAVLEYGIIKRMSWTGELSEDEFPQVSDGKKIAEAIYKRFADGHKDWSLFFKWAMTSKDSAAMSKCQRLLLLMVSVYGPHDAFKEFVLPPVLNKSRTNQPWTIYDLTLYCDIFRLSMVYHQKLDEQALFNMLINKIPMAPIRLTKRADYYDRWNNASDGMDESMKRIRDTNLAETGWQTFIDSAEWIVMCLLLSSSSARHHQLSRLAEHVTRWLPLFVATDDRDHYAETLTVVAFLGISTLTDLVPEKIELNQLLEKRKVFWIQYAMKLAQTPEKSFKELCRQFEGH